MKKTPVLTIAFAIAASVALGALGPSPADAQTLRVHPNRLRVAAGELPRAAAFAIQNRTKRRLVIETISVPARMTLAITAFRAGNRTPMLTRNRASESQRRRWQTFATRGVTLDPGGMILASLSSRTAPAGTRRLVIRYRDAASSKWRQARASVHVHHTLAPATCKTNRDVCFVAFGDHGTGDSKQRRVANAMRRFSKEANPRTDFVVGLGDNFYPTGLTVFNRLQRFKHFEETYAGINVPFYMSLGNHDHYGDWRNQMKYQRCRKRWCQKSWNTKRWRMPNNYYKFRKGDVEFFALDTPRMDRRLTTRGFALTGMNRMIRWLDRSLERSTARWKVVYGHHPVINYGESHHDELDSIVERLLPLLVKHNVDVYIAGHEHDQQLIRLPTLAGKRTAGLDFIVSGSAGKSSGHARRGPGSKFADASLGFAHLAISGDRLTIRFVKAQANGSPKVIHRSTRLRRR